MNPEQAQAAADELAELDPESLDAWRRQFGISSASELDEENDEAIQLLTDRLIIARQEEGNRAMRRVDITFEGAVESMNDFTDPEAAQDTFENLIQEHATEAPDKNWTVDLYDTTAEPPELLDTHEHEAEDEYEVVFSVRVHAESTEEAEANAKDHLGLFIDTEEPSSIKVVTEAGTFP